MPQCAGARGRSTQAARPGIRVLIWHERLARRGIGARVGQLTPELLSYAIESDAARCLLC